MAKIFRLMISQPFGMYSVFFALHQQPLTGVGCDDGCEASAVMKCIFANFCDRPEGDGCEISAATKCTIANECDQAREGDGCKVGTAFKCTKTNFVTWARRVVDVGLVQSANALWPISVTESGR